MATFRGHFDGHVLVPDEPVDLPVGTALEISAAIPESNEFDRPVLSELAEILRNLPDNPNMPADASIQHDHYLYGVPKKQ